MTILPPQNLTSNSSHFLKSRRKYPRLPAQDLCVIKTERGAVGIACKIHNISDGGAMIEVSSAYVPDRFLLINHTLKTKALSKVVWRNENLIGVEFKTGPKRLPDGSFYGSQKVSGQS